MKGESVNEQVRLGAGDALIVVDVQRDFLPGGSLAVGRGDEVVAPLNRYMERFEHKGLPVLATRDWHPADHCSFREQGGRWPVHCVVDTPGAEFAPGARNKFHTHSREQILYVTEGKGIVATRDKEYTVTPGTVVYIPVNEEHWHGATKDSSFAHLSIIGGPQEMKITEK